MLSLSDTTDLLNYTTDQLMAESGRLTAQASITQIDQWIPVLREAQNMQPIADELSKLKALLQVEPVNNDAVQTQLESLAQTLTTLSADMGSEGEMPGLFTGLAAALRQTATPFSEEA